MRSTRTLLASGFALIATLVIAQAPQAFSYQAVARDANGDALASHALDVQFQLHQGSALGTVVYAESHSTTTNDHGLFTLQVGGGAPGTGTFSAIDWRSGPYFLEVLMDMSSSGSFASMGTQQLLSVPYALYAASSNLPNGTEVGQIAHWTGSEWAVDSGLYVSGKRFGIGDTAPVSPLGIKGEVGQDDQMISLQSSSGTQKWNINLNPTGADAPGFSIDDASSGVSTSRLFIADSTGHIGIGTQDPPAPLALVSRSVLKQYFQTGDVPASSDFGFTSDSTGFGIDQGTPASLSSRLFVQDPTGHVGLGTQHPPGALTIRSGTALKEYFQTGDVPTQSDFGTMIDSRGMGMGQGTPDSLSIDLLIQSTTGHVGIGTDDPPAPLAIKSRETLKTYFETGDVPTEQQFYGISTDTTGFDIGQGPPDALQSRLFLQASSGNVGLGTIDPTEKLHVEDSSPNSIVGIRILNTATVANQGFSMGHLHDASSVRDGAFSLFEESSAGTGPVERITVLPTQYIGINEPTPSTTLHVSRPASDPLSLVDLQENTGIITVGPIEQNIVFDAQGIQAKQLVAGTTSIQGASHLRLQPLGGDIQIHGEDALASNQVTITSDGKIGVGKDPTEKVDINGAIRIGDTQTASPADGTIRFNGTDFEGWVAGDWAIFNGNVWEKVDNSDKILYNSGTDPRVGIGEPVPDTRLHVSRALSDPAEPVALAEGTGTVVIGPITDNIVFDHESIQARHLLGGSTSVIGSSGLRLQPLGGDIVIHDNASLDSQKFIIKDDGFVGLGTLTPEERLHVNGAIIVGDASSSSPADGTIRWTGTDFEGRKGGSWNSLTTHTNTDGLWQTAPTGGIEYSPPGGGAKVSLSLPAPTGTVRVDSWAAIVERSTGAVFQNTVTTSSTDPADNRIGVEIKNSGTWGGDPLSKNIGLYVSDVSGGSSANRNLAAVLNGNVVIGDVTGSQPVGTSGTNVLAIQNGAAPATPPSSSSGLPDAGVQLYSAGDATGTSVFHLMNGDGTVIQLARQNPLHVANMDGLNPIYDGGTAAVIENMRTRINELEAILKNVGLLAP